jgi:hypothetical protein
MSPFRGSQAKFLHVTFMLLLFGALIASVVPSSPALACTPTSTPSGFAGYTIADYINTADIILEGTVTNLIQYVVEPPDTVGLGASLGSDVAAIEVERYFKGSGQVVINIQGFGQPGACAIVVGVGSRGIFYAFSDTQGVFWVLAHESIRRDTIAQIQQTTGQLPVTPSTQTTLSPDSIQTTPSSNTTPENYSLIGNSLGIVAIGIVIIMVMLARRPRRNAAGSKPQGYK